jgi:hypothetical protein
MMEQFPRLRLVRRSVECEIASTTSRLRALAQVTGNPWGISIRPLAGGAVALMAHQLPVPSFNSVVGLQAGHEREIAELAAWYGAAGVSARFETVPAYYDWALGAALARLGYYQSGMHASLVCEPRLDLPAAANGIAIERILGAPALDELPAVIAPGLTMAGPGCQANVQDWLEPPGHWFYLARLDGKPAAAAILYVADKVGYCADTAIDPALRGRGLYAALLHHLIADASASGVDFVCGGADFLSQRHRAMERAGMRVLFVRGLWTAL